MKPASVIFCEICAAGPLAADLANAATFCAGQAGIALDVVSRSAQDTEPVMTLHLGPDEASPDHPVWCLVCRLACLCPQARVGTLVHASGCFSPRRQPSARTA